MKKIKLFLTILVVAILSVCAVACGGDGEENKQYTVTFASESAEKGTVTGTKNGNAIESGAKHDNGAQIALTARPNPGYAFSGWFDGSDAQASSNLTYSFTLSGDVSYTAKFSALDYIVLFSSSDTQMGTVALYDANDQPVQGNTFTYGMQLKAVATPKTGYSLDGWYVGNTQVDTSAVLNITVTETVTYVAQFSVNTYACNFNVNHQDWGSVSAVDGENQTVHNNDLLAHGTQVTFTATPKTGYYFVAWQDQHGENVSDLISFKETVSEAISYTAIFAKYKYAVAFKSEPEEMGTVSGALTAGGALQDGDEVEHGVSVTLTARANAGYKFLGWFDGTGLVESDSTYSVTVEKALAVEARFEKEKYTLTFTFDQTKGNVVANGGLISPASVTFGQSVTLTAVAGEGYVVSGWKETGKEGVVCATAAYTFEMPAGAYAVEPIFTAQQRTVVFYEGYDKLHEATVDYGTAVTEYKYEKANYSFDGWYKDAAFSDGTRYDDFTLPVTTNLTLFAKWNALAVSFTFVYLDEKDGAPLTVTDTVTEGQPILSVPGTPSKIGYDFAGWYYDVGGVATPFASGLIPTSDIEIYATWTVQTFTVTFCADEDAHGTVGHSDSTQSAIPYGGYAQKPTHPDKPEHTFLYWKDSETGAEFNFNTPIAKDYVLTAVWKVIEKTVYTVTFLSEKEGSIVATQSVQEGDKVSAPMPVNTGHTFVDWRISEGEVFDVATPVAGNLTVYATWRIQTFTVVFLDMAGTQISTQTVDYGAPATAPAQPTVIGYTSMGWATDYTNVTSDLTIKPVYEIKTFTVTFYDGDTSLGSATVQEGQNVAIPTTPTKDSTADYEYKFAGWFADENCTANNHFDFTQAIMDDTSVYAKFTESKILEVFTVTFMSRDGVIISKQEVLEGNDASLPANVSRTGFTFTGWSSTAYLNVSASVTIYAEFERNEYAVTFLNKDGGVLLETTVLYEESAASVAPEAPTVDGMRFSGWDKNINLPVTKDITFTATYALETRTVIFMVMGDKLTETSVAYGSKVNAPSTPIKNGYTFRYWYTDDENTPFDFDTAITQEPTTLYAKYDVLAGMHEVTFIGGDGENHGNPQVVADGKFAIEPRPYTDGTDTVYKWCVQTSPNEYELFDFATTPITASITLYARADA